jgi:hypothetical protein
VNYSDMFCTGIAIGLKADRFQTDKYVAIGSTDPNPDP